MHNIAWFVMCWLLIWAVGKFFNDRARRKKLDDERRGL